MTMTKLAFAAQAYLARAPQLISQECINAFVESSPKDAKTPVPVFGTPGLSTFSRQGNGPINVLHIFQNKLFAMSSNQLFSIDSSGVVTLIGTTNMGGLMQAADNGQQMVIVNGTAAWIYQPLGLNQVSTAAGNAGDTSITANITGTLTGGDTLTIPLDSGDTFTTTVASTVDSSAASIPLSTALPSTVSSGAVMVDAANVLAQIKAAAFMPANTVTFFDGYFCFDAAGTRQFFISGNNDGTQYSGLDFATATASSSDVVAVRAYHEQLLIFTGESVEVWWDTGNASFPFQRYDAAYIERGCASPYSVISEDNTVFWMGEDGIFYRLNGFVPNRISTHAMETAWDAYPQKFTDCQGFSITQQGHKFLVLSFISGNQTWCYDISTGLWHRRESMGTMWV